MYKNILIPVALDHGSVVADTVRVARRLLSEGGKITLLSVLEELPAYVVEYVSVKPESKLLQEVRKRLDAIAEGQTDAETMAVSGNPGVAIADFAAKSGIDLIIVESHRPGLQEYFLGSTAARVVRRAPCAVFVLR